MRTGTLLLRLGTSSLICIEGCAGGALGGSGVVGGAGHAATTASGGASTSSTTTGPGGAGGAASTGGAGGAASTGGAGGAASTGGAGGAASTGGGAVGALFEAPNPWTKKVDALAKDATSDAVMGWLEQAGGWGTGQMRIDFSLELLFADANTPFKSFTPTGDYYAPDGDAVPFPVPAGGALEGEPGYECTMNGDCHLLVVHGPTKKLYEMWRANLVGNAFEGGATAVWDLTKAYGPTLRGEGCTSADAGGFPVAALIFSADEVASGHLDHAIRFILPNSRIRKLTYVHPGTHSTFATSGGANAPPYGVRLRLRAGYPVQILAPGARVIAKAMQTYGMLLADGGNIALTAQSDRATKNKWAALGVDSYSLAAIEPKDMEVVDLGQPIVWDGNCVRN